MHVTVRLYGKSKDGRSLGSFLHPAEYLDPIVLFDDRRYRVVASDDGPAKQTLYVVPEEE